MRSKNNSKGTASNPAKAVRRPQEKAIGGFHSWAPEEIARYESGG